MSHQNKNQARWLFASISLSGFLLALGMGYWWYNQKGDRQIGWFSPRLESNNLSQPSFSPTPTPTTSINLTINEPPFPLPQVAR